MQRCSNQSLEDDKDEVAKRTLAAEKKTIEMMIRMFCRSHHSDKQLCSRCTELLEYAHQQLQSCPFGENK